jgi:hypothetical protein
MANNLGAVLQRIQEDTHRRDLMSEPAPPRFLGSGGSRLIARPRKLSAAGG